MAGLGPHALPALTLHFGLKKADLWDLTPIELDGYLALLKEITTNRKP